MYNDESGLRTESSWRTCNCNTCWAVSQNSLNARYTMMVLFMDVSLIRSVCRDVTRMDSTSDIRWLIRPTSNVGIGLDFYLEGVIDCWGCTWWYVDGMHGFPMVMDWYFVTLLTRQAGRYRPDDRFNTKRGPRIIFTSISFIHVNNHCYTKKWQTILQIENEVTLQPRDVKCSDSFQNRERTCVKKGFMNKVIKHLPWKRVIRRCNCLTRRSSSSFNGSLWWRVREEDCVVSSSFGERQKRVYAGQQKQKIYVSPMRTFHSWLLSHKEKIF